MKENTKHQSMDTKDKMLKFYNIKREETGAFLLQVDWLLENSVLPKENDYAQNLMELWNVYMPNYKFDRIVLDYSKKYFPVLRFIHDEELDKFKSAKFMQEAAMKNYLKSRISQGESSRVTLIKECFEAFKDVSDRTKLYEFVNRVIDGYFSNGEIEQYAVMFLKRFEDYNEQVYEDILDRLQEFNEQKEQISKARVSLGDRLKAGNREEFMTLINIVLCRLALADGEKKFSDVLENIWKDTVPNVKYNDAVYRFVDKFEKPYMTAACFGIKGVRDKKVIQQLYKDAIILCAAVECMEKDEHFGIKEINDFWKKDGMRFSKGYFFDDEYERMKEGLDKKLLLKYKSDIEAFRQALIAKIDGDDLSNKSHRSGNKERRSSYEEMGHVVINEKERQISDLQERITELEEKLESQEREILAQFISLLDSKKYDHVLGKLYRRAYAGEEFKTEDIQGILKNLFEIMNISGIDIYGEIDTDVQEEELKKGKYRVDAEIKGKACVKYPGYKWGDTVILHPLAEEV